MNEISQYPGRLAIQQRVLPAYRAPFFEALAAACAGGLSVFAGQPLPDEQIASAQRLQTAQLVQARNRHLFKVSSPFYQCWQGGFIDWLEALAAGCLDRGSQPALPQHASRGALDARPRPGRLGLGAGSAASERDAGWLAAPLAPGLLAFSGRRYRLQPARRAGIS